MKIRLSVMKSLLGEDDFNAWIEKARKGEQAANHKYIARKPSGNEKRPWIYFMLEDFLKNPIKRLEEFFNVSEKEVDEKYEKHNIKKDFGADKKTFAQHIAEYFAHRSVWDKRFADKDNRKKMEKPIKMVDSDKTEIKGMETPETDNLQQEFDFGGKKIREKQEWKANPSLMRRIWGMYTGKSVEKEEKQQKVVEQTVNKPILEDLKKKAYEYGKKHSDMKQVSDEALEELGIAHFNIGEGGKDVLQAFRDGQFDENEKIANQIIEQNVNKPVNIENKENQKTKNQFSDVTDIRKLLDKRDEAEKKLKEIAIKRDAEIMTDERITLLENAKKIYQDIYKDADQRLKELVPEDDDFVLIKTNTAVTPNVTGVKNVDWFQAFAGSWNRFYPNGTGRKPYIDASKIDGKGRKVTTFVRAKSKTDLSDLIPEDINDFVFDSTHLSERQKNAMLGRLAEQGFIPQKQYVDDKGETKHILMIREGSRSGNVEMIPNPDYKTKEYTVNVRDDEGKIVESKVFNDIDDTYLFMDSKRRELNNGEHGNKIAMLGNQNAKKYGLSDEEYKNVAKEIYDFAKLQILYPTDSKDLDLLIGILNNSRSEKDKILAKKLKQISQESGKYLSELLVDGYNDYIRGENENGTNNNRTEPSGISERIGDIRSGRSEESGSGDVPETGYGADKTEFGISPVESGIGSGNETAADDRRNDDRGRGRITKGEARKIRAKCRELLAAKKDSEMTEADKAILAQYVGAGGTDEEGASNSGVLYEFYTPRNVIDKVWQLVDKYNPSQNKKVIEPSSGIGRFAEGRNENFTLFELEEDSARIAGILHPNAEIVQGAFQENFIKRGRFTSKNFEKFDVAVGNPPYGAYTGKYKGMGEGKGHTRYDEYFIDRTLDILKDGGILAFVMPSHFLSSGNSKIKEKLAEKGKLLEAWRLPNGTFDSTDVGTDIVIIRKEKGNAEDFSNSKYFSDNPKHIAGEQATRIGRFGEETYIKVKDGEDFETAVSNIDVNAVEVDKAVEEVKKEIETKVEDVPKNEVSISSMLKYTEESGTAKNGNTYKIAEPTEEFWEYYKDHKEDMKASGFTLTKIGGRFGKWKVYDYNVEGNKPRAKKTEAEKHENRSRAMMGNKNAEGEHFVASIGKNQTAEEFNKKYGKDFDPKDIEIWKATDNFGNVDETKLTDEQRKYVENSDHYVTENGKFINVVNYASGNIREKLKNLDPSDSKYEFKKSLLEAAKPVDKEIGQFTLSPIADWTKEYQTKDGEDLISRFFAWAYNGNGYYSASNSPIAAEEIPADISFYDISDYIKAIPVRAESRNGEDQKYNQRVAYRKRELRRQTAEKLFNRFLKEGLTLEEQKDLKDKWNENFNTYVNPDYKKIPVFIDGMNTHKGTKEFTLTEQQIKGITQLTNKGTGLLAYDVGVGKTVTGIAATVNQIQTGRAKRPLICVPKSVYKKWIEEIHQHFPNIKVNELGNLSKNYISEDFVPEDGSISVCTYQGLEKFEFNADSEAKILEDLEFGALYSEGRGEESARAKASREEKEAEVLGGMLKTKGDTVSWEQMGFDHITVDEVHNFRNLFSAPRKIYKSEDEKKQNEANEFKALGGGKPSNQAKKLFAITQLIQRENDGRNTFLLSATPFQNSPIEIYSILSYMARDKLKALGIYSLEQFVKQFADLKSEYVVKVNKIEEKMVMKNFNNLTALQNLITEYIDKVDGEEAGVARPYKRTHAPELELSEMQKEIMAQCNEYIAEQEKKPKDKRDPGYMFRAMNAMRNCALSPALVDDEFFPDGYDKPPMSQIVESSPKLKFVCDSVIGQYKKNSKNGQVIYMPSGVEQFPEVKDYLVKHGIPKDAVALMAGSASTDKKLDERQAIMKDFNDVEGKCKVIIGSSTIKEGVSLNGNSTVIYNTQLDWNPTDAQQVEGRIWRQGNKQGITHVVYPLMHDSIDSMIYQKFDEKASRISDLFSYKGDSLNVEDINPEELKFGLIKDPAKRADMQVREYKEKAESDQKLYAQMSDVLYKQAKFAFEDDPGKTMVKDRYGYPRTVADSIAEQEKNVAYTESVIADIEKKYKEMGEDFTWKQNWHDYNGKEGYKKLLEEKKNDMKTHKAYISSYNRILKKAQDQQKALIANLATKGIKSMDDVNAKQKEYARLREEARENAEKADEMREVFYQKAVEDNARNAVNIPSLEEMVKINVDSIMGDLKPFKEVEGQIRQELAAKYGIKKSEYAFFMKNGRFLMRKSLAEKIVKSLNM